MRRRRKVVKNEEGKQSNEEGGEKRRREEETNKEEARKDQIVFSYAHKFFLHFGEIVIWWARPLNQTHLSTIFAPIFLSYFSILLKIIWTKHTIRVHPKSHNLATYGLNLLFNSDKRWLTHLTRRPIFSDKIFSKQGLE